MGLKNGPGWAIESDFEAIGHEPCQILLPRIGSAKKSVSDILSDFAGAIGLLLSMIALGATGHKIFVAGISIG